MLQPIIDIAEICAKHGIKHVVLSPGSRCAPLTLAMVRHPKLEAFTITDERSAAFIALGLSQFTGLPTVLICTSGSAGLNYAPAVAEAYYQRIPLLVLTADRPPEWIDQQDGQTIRQEQLFGRHAKNSFSLPADLTHRDAQWHVNRTVNEAILETTSAAPGPVHINVPLREPFYPEAGADYGYSENVRIIRRTAVSSSLAAGIVESLLKEIKNSQKILVVPGQQKPWESLAPVEDFCNSTGAVMVTDMISNHSASGIAIRHHDLFIKNKKLAERLRPHLLITYGGSIISKNLKEFLRLNKPQEHWHISLEPTFADTFQSLSRHVISTATDFFSALNGKLKSDGVTDYQQKWKEIEGKVYSTLEADSFEIFTEMAATRIVLEKIPAGNCHLANSMPVRYANTLNPGRKDLNIYCNRGTSGIDGSTSTAVGMALATDEHVTLITGDLAFFYDRNGLWNRYLPSNLTIVVMNNHAGGIFRLVDGASKQPELEEYFETEQPLNAQLTTQQHGLEYSIARTAGELQEILQSLSKQQDRPRIIEIEIDSAESAAHLRSLQSRISEEINNHY